MACNLNKPSLSVFTDALPFLLLSFQPLSLLSHLAIGILSGSAIVNLLSQSNFHTLDNKYFSQLMSSTCSLTNFNGHMLHPIALSPSV